MPCPSCGHNLVPEARLVLAETGQKEGFCLLLVAIAVGGVLICLW